MTLELKKLDEQKNRNLNDIINDRKRLEAIEKLILNKNYSVIEKNAKVDEINIILNNKERNYTDFSKESSLFPINPIEGAPFCQGFLFYIADNKYFTVDPNYTKLLKGHANRHLATIGQLGKTVISSEKAGALMVEGMQKAKIFTDKGISDNTIAKGHPFRSILDHCVTLDALKKYNSKLSSTEAGTSSTVVGSFPEELEGLYWVSHENLNSSNSKNCRDVIAQSKEMILFYRFYPDKTYVALKAGAGNKYGKSAEFDHFMRGSNKVTKKGEVMQFESIQIQPGNVRQTILYRFNSKHAQLERVKGIECRNCEGGAKIAFDHLNEKSELYSYWCKGKP